MIPEDGWRVLEVFGLWAAAAVGYDAILSGTRDASTNNVMLCNTS
jgi:hypothetical protein